MGYPTPLTHPASSGDPRGGFTTPINDPRLAPFFATRKVGVKPKGGWQPPEPPIPPEGKFKEQAIPIGQQILFPFQPKVQTKSEKRHAAPPALEVDDSESSGDPV